MSYDSILDVVIWVNFGFVILGILGVVACLLLIPRLFRLVGKVKKTEKFSKKIGIINSVVTITTILGVLIGVVLGMMSYAQHVEQRVADIFEQQQGIEVQSVKIRYWSDSLSPSAVDVTGIDGVRYTLRPIIGSGWTLAD